jgi:uncharacterized coiled-coil DUF342 family protein
MSQELQTLADRIGKKSVAIDNERKKIVNLEGQIELYQRSKDKLLASIDEKSAEVALLLEIQNQIQPLVSKRDSLNAEMNKLVKHFEQFEWRVDMPYEEKLESSAYPSLRDEKFRIASEIDELVKQANKIYYRR